MLFSTDKMNSFQAEVKLWNTKVQDGNMSMFPKCMEIKCNDLSTLIFAHLTSLKEKSDQYFPELSFDFQDWIRNPFIEYPPDKINLNLTDKEELIEICIDRTLRTKHSEITIDSFLILIKQEYPKSVKRPLKVCYNFQHPICVNLDFLHL